MRKTIFIVCLLCVWLWTPVVASYADEDVLFYQDRITTAEGLAHYCLGYMYDLLGKEKDAVIEYKAAAEADRECYLIHLRLATDYIRLGKLDDAVLELKLVSKYKPSDLNSHYLLALIFSSRKEYGKAADEYEIILRSLSKENPKNIEIYGYLAQLYYSQKKYDKAIKQFEKMIELDPKNANVMYLLGSIYLELGRKKEAVDILKKAIKIDPNNDGSLNTLAYIYAEEGQRLDEALDFATRALVIDPDNGAYLDSLGWVYYKKGMYKKALEILKRANKRLRDPIISEHLGDVYYKLNRIDEALKYWQGSLELLPGQTEVIRKINSVKNAQVKKTENAPTTTTVP